MKNKLLKESIQYSINTSIEDPIDKLVIGFINYPVHKLVVTEIHNPIWNLVRRLVFHRIYSASFKNYIFQMKDIKNRILKKEDIIEK